MARPTTPHYGIAKYGPRDTADPMDVYTVYNEAMETIDRILFDFQEQLSDLNKKVEDYNRALNKRIDDLDAKVENYNSALNTRIDNLDAKVENYNTATNKRIDELKGEFKAFKDEVNKKFDAVNTNITNLGSKTDNIWTAIQNIVNKVKGAGTINRGTGNITFGESGHMAVGNINLNAGSGYIRTHDGTADNDIKVV